MRLLLIIVVLIILFGGLPIYPYSRTWGYYGPTPGVILLVILLVLILLGRV